MAEIHTNFARSTLAAGITDVATSLTVASGDGALFPNPGAGEQFRLVVIDTSGNREVMICTARATDVLTVTRAQEGTTGRAFLTGDRVSHRFTAGSVSAIATEALANVTAQQWCGTAGGTANAFTLTPSPAATSYTAGLMFGFIAVGTNTGATTVNVSGLGVKNVYVDGATLDPNYLVSGATYYIIYNGTQFTLLNPSIVYAEEQSGLVPFRNRIINGAFRFDQINNGSTYSDGGSGILGPDMWTVASHNGGNGRTSLAREADPDYPGEYNALLTVTTNDTSVSGGEYYSFYTIIEGYNTVDLGWGAAGAKSVTLSFEVKSSVAGTFCVKLGNGANDRSYIAEYTINATNTVERKTITIPGDVTGTWLKTNSNGILVDFILGNGTTYQGVTGWQSGNYLASAAQTNTWIGTSSATFRLKRVQLERGDVATPFVIPPYADELAQVQRYYEIGREPFLYATWGLSMTAAYGSVSFATTKRSTSGTMTFTGWKYYSGGTGVSVTPVVNNVYADNFQWTASGLTDWNGWTGEGYWTCNARLS